MSRDAMAMATEPAVVVISDNERNHDEEVEHVVWVAGQHFEGRITGELVGTDAVFRFSSKHEGRRYDWDEDDETTLVPAHDKIYRDALRRIFQRRAAAALFQLQASASWEDQSRAVSLLTSCNL